VQRALDYAERLFVVLLIGPFLVSILRVAPDRPSLILNAISECLVVGLTLIRKPGQMATKPYPIALAIIASAAPLLVRPSGGASLILADIAAVIACAGLALNIWAKLILSRSFGLAPANRGVKVGGPYRFVRHPMYLGYIVTQASFLLANFTIWNLCQYALAWIAQILRISEEEKLLSSDDEYVALRRRVRFRLVPGVY